MKKWILIIPVILLYACEKQAERYPASPCPELLVISGMITDEHKSHRIYISEIAANANTIPDPVSNATVVISDGILIWELTESDTCPGMYLTDSTAYGIPGRTYTLTVEYYGNTYTASDIMSDNSSFTPLVYSQAQDSGQYKVSWVCIPYNPNKPAVYEVVTNWSHLDTSQNLCIDNCSALMYYYSLPTIDVSEIFTPDIQNITFPEGTIITERKYAISQGYAEYLRCMLLETNWRGGLFDGSASNLPTNFTTGVAGYFSACSVIEISLTVTP